MYCTVEDVRARNPVLLRIDNFPDARIAGFIEYAGGIVDGILSTRYSVPIAPVCALVREITADLAAAKCLILGVGNSGIDRDPVQAGQLEIKALDLLKLIAAGTIALNDYIGETPGLSDTYGVESVFCKWNPNDADTYK